MGSQYVNDFDFNNRTYRVFVQADQPFRMTESDLHNFYVRSDSGPMVPLDNLVTVVNSSGPPVINHYDLFRSVEIDGSAAPGYSSGQAIQGMQQLAQQVMMPGMMYEWTGLTLDELESAGKALLIFGLGILVVYLTLSAQYESFALPFIILLAVPMAVLGALGLVALRGMANDVYCQIGLVMLIGLSAKNAILIVEFAEQLRAQGALHRRGGHRSGGTASSPDSHDLVCIHPRHPAPGLRHRCGRARTPLGGNHHRGRHAVFHGAEPVLYSHALCDSERHSFQRSAARRDQDDRGRRTRYCFSRCAMM